MIDKQFIASTPTEIGLDPAKLQRVYDYVQTQIDAGLPSAQVAIGRHGKVAEVKTFGTVTKGGVTGPATDDTLYCLFSAAKGTTGVGAWSLIEDGLLRLDERVADIVPEFAGGGKDDITVEQLVTFTSGFPTAPMNPKLWEDRAARLERIKGWRLNWEPGSRYQYHATSAHWVLAEIMTYRTGLDFRDYVRTRLYEPMGVPDLRLGVPDELHHRIADIVYVDPPVEPKVAGLVRTTRGPRPSSTSRRLGAPAVRPRVRIRVQRTSRCSISAWSRPPSPASTPCSSPRPSSTPRRCSRRSGSMMATAR